MSGPGQEGVGRAADAPGAWVETPEGGFFFLNAVLVIPELVVLVPLSLKALLGLVGSGGPSVYLDTIPSIARYVLPWTGWILVVPAWTTLRNLRMELPSAARAALVAMLLSHLGFLAWTAWLWIGGGAG